MSTSPPPPPEAPNAESARDLQMRAWIDLRHEFVEMQARLEYLRLLVALRVGRPRGPGH